MLLSKTKGELVFCESYRDALLGEVAIWRVGGSVPEEEWATEQRVKMLMVAGGARQTATASSSASSGLSAPTSSRSSTPGPDGLPRASTPQDRLDADERDDFLRRENELNDMVAEKESALNRQEAELQQLRRELDHQKVRNEQLAKVRRKPPPHSDERRADQIPRTTRASRSNSQICACCKSASKKRLEVMKKAFSQQETARLASQESLSDCDARPRSLSDRMRRTWQMSERRRSKTCWQT